MACWIFLLQGRVDIALASGTFFLSMFDYYLRATFLETLVLVLMAMSAFVMSSDSEAWGSNSQHLLEMCRACRGVGHSQAFWSDFPYLLCSVPVPDFFLIGDVNQRNKPVSNCPSVVHDEPCPVRPGRGALSPSIPGCGATAAGMSLEVPSHFMELWCICPAPVASRAASRACEVAHGQVIHFYLIRVFILEVRYHHWVALWLQLAGSCSGHSCNEHDPRLGSAQKQSVQWTSWDSNIVFFWTVSSPLSRCRWTNGILRRLSCWGPNIFSWWKVFTSRPSPHSWRCGKTCSWSERRSFGTVGLCSCPSWLSFPGISLVQWKVWIFLYVPHRSSVPASEVCQLAASP